MQFFTILAATASVFAAQSFAAPVLQDAGKKFGLITIHSGSNYHLLPVKRTEGNPDLFSLGGVDGTEVIVTLQKDGSLKTDDGKFVYNSEEGLVGLGAGNNITDGFYLENNELRNKDFSFYACTSGAGYTLLSKGTEGSGCGGVALMYSEVQN